MNSRRLYTASDFYRERFGCKAYKLALDAGCTCPNRDGTKGYGGCIFCSQTGSGDFAASRRLPVAEQICVAQRLVASKMPAGKPGVYIAYFQNYSNTYGNPARLEQLYREALAVPGIAGLAVATRPDCLENDILDRLARVAWEPVIKTGTVAHIVPTEIGQTVTGDAGGVAGASSSSVGFGGVSGTFPCGGFGGVSEAGTGNAGSNRTDCVYSNMKPDTAACPFVSLELGLQTVNPATASYIRCGYTAEDYGDAVRRIKIAAPQIHVVTHIIFGLPGDTEQDMMRTVDTAVAAGTDGIKFTVLYVLKGTPLAKDYAALRFRCLEMEEYFRLLSRAVSRIPSETVIHRLTGDGPKSLLIAPRWTADKKTVHNRLHQYFERHHVVQGSEFVK